jgi:hypothetical protein
MKLYGKAQATANTILQAFQSPESLPKAIAPIFIRRNEDTPCRKWSWNNQLLTALAATHDARGYKQWQSVERHVKKGAKAFTIFAPCTKKIEQGGEDKVICFGFRAISVFRIEDTEGKDVPSGDPTLDDWIKNLPLRGVAESWGVSVHTYNGEEGRGQGKFSPAGQSIGLGVQNAEVFFHELIHAADHRLGNLVERGQHWKSETVAEFGSAILAECLGLECSNLGGAYSYIESYAKAAEKTPQAACLECLDRICKAVSYVLDAAQALETASGKAVA